jgi:hypothetical protein
LAKQASFENLQTARFATGERDAAIGRRRDLAHGAERFDW